LPTSAGGDLALDQEREYEMQLGLAIAPHSEREPIDVVCARYRLADERGGLWEAVTHFTPEVFLQALGNMAGRHPTRFEEARKGAPRGQVLLAGVRGVIDDGASRHVLVDRWVASFEGRGQAPRFDLFFHRGDFLVRLSGLVGHRRRLAL